MRRGRHHNTKRGRAADFALACREHAKFSRVLHRSKLRMRARKRAERAARKRRAAR